MPKTAKFKYILGFFLILLIFVICGILFFSSKPSRFEGTVMEVRDKSVLVRGIYPALGDRQHLSELEIAINNSTKITRTSFDFPRDGRMVNVDKLPKKDSLVSFPELKADSQRTSIGIFVDLEWSIWDFNKPTAKEIKYLAPKP